VRVRLDVTDVQSGLLLRAAGARPFAFNWAVAKIKANADQWAYDRLFSSPAQIIGAPRERREAIPLLG
jgi:hypothetical protein